MNTARVTRLRSVELAVTDLAQSAAFYSRVWGWSRWWPTATLSICVATAPSTMR